MGLSFARFVSCLLTLQALVVFAVDSASETLVETTSGPVQGYLDTNTTNVHLHKWYGVRFASDTSGQNRWKPPIPYHQQNVFNATAFGPACLQGRVDGGNGTSIQSEDCLRINVIAPVGAKNLPVYLYS